MKDEGDQDFFQAGYDKEDRGQVKRPGRSPGEEEKQSSGHQLRAGVLDNVRTLGVDRLHVVNLRLTDGPATVPFDEQLDVMVAMRVLGSFS